jgi:acetyl esterase/lipase
VFPFFATLNKNTDNVRQGNYTRDPKKRQEIYTSPLLATKEQVSGLPPALAQTAENAILREESEAYARKLNEAGVKVIATRYNGMIHDWGLLNAISQVTATKSALLQAAVEFKKAPQSSKLLNVLFFQSCCKLLCQQVFIEFTSGY